MYFLTPPVRFPCYIVYHNFVLLAMTRKTIPPTVYNEPTLIISSLTQLIILKNENKSYEFSTIPPYALQILGRSSLLYVFPLPNSYSLLLST